MPELEDKKDESKEEKEVLDLDQTHERVLEELEREDDAEDKSDDGADDDEGSDDSDKDDQAGDGDSDDTKDDADDEDQPAPPEPPIKKEDQPAPELEGVAVKDYQGKVHTFKNFDEIPDDFEPASYKEFAQFTVNMNQKLDNDKKREEDRLAEEDRRATEARVQEIKDGWEKDIKALTDSKALPADQKERQKVVEAVYGLMDEELIKGRVLDFAPAYEVWAYRQSQKQAEQKHQEQVKDKKDKGSKIQGQNSPTPTKSRSFEAPPSGISLDQVHEQVMNDL